MSHSCSVKTTLDIKSNTAFETIPCVLMIVEVFIISSESKPSSGVTSSSGEFEIAEGIAWIKSNIIWEGTGSSQGSSQGDGFGYDRGDLALRRVIRL